MLRRLAFRLVALGFQSGLTDVQVYIKCLDELDVLSIHKILQWIEVRSAAQAVTTINVLDIETEKLAGRHSERQDTHTRTHTH